ncbi:hypothetical protein QP119_05160 [Corynebacterium frankenforstense]|uniref:YkvI family membrane protein n=1 Tax=Corynebacterium frankenforstense TaxID=1230998 RepID=UPI00254D4FD9|nr:hypothetical protein [Corynebacterium frankenforstense]MDK6259812.1 hypothetical protein [Corynebacterium frankenforstense]
MNVRRTISIALAFVGLLVGAGFATGAEVIQYFLSHGSAGLWGALMAGVIMSVAGAVILQLGSYFLADQHNRVFRNVAHPVVSKFLDISVMVTLFAFGFVMLAGAGSNVEQQFGIPAWLGSGIMTALVIFVGMFDVDKVSEVISAITPAIIVAVVVVFVYTMFNLPGDFSLLNEVALQQDSPISPWWLSALNYCGLALILGVSMCLVIGGNYASPKEAGVGGLSGGILYMVLMLMAASSLYLNMAAVGDSDVPMLAMFENMHPIAGFLMSLVIFAMIFNTCIGMFYALGKRITVGQENRYRPYYIVLCLIGYVVSFVGFDSLMSSVYPIIGWLGMALVVVLVAWWIKNRKRIYEEITRRERIYELAYNREHPDEEFSRADARELDEALDDSSVTSDSLRETIVVEVADDLLNDDEVDYEPEGKVAQLLDESEKSDFSLEDSGKADAEADADTTAETTTDGAGTGDDGSHAVGNK